MALRGAARGRRRRDAILAAAVALPLLGGCSALPAGLGLAEDPSDPCHADRSKFADSQNYFTESLVSGALMGGLVGAVTGALTGPRGSNTGQRALMGFGAGAVTGAGAAYLASVAQRHPDTEGQAQQINADLSRENSEIDRANADFRRLRACRFNQAAHIKAMARQGLISQAEAQARLAQVRRQFNEEIRLARQSNDNMRKRDAEYRDAAGTLGSAAGSGAGGHGSGATRQAVTDATVTLPKKREEYETAVTDAEVRSKDVLGDEALGA